MRNILRRFVQNPPPLAVGFEFAQGFGYNAYMKKLYTLCLVHDESRVLLGMKKRGFGEGRWNGFGGKIKADETIEEALHRELAEEAGIEIQNPMRRGVLTFAFEGNPIALEVHVYGATQFRGAPQETEEMRPQWFAKNAIPFDEMWPDDRYWFPFFFAGKNFTGQFSFHDQNNLRECTVEEI